MNKQREALQLALDTLRGWIGIDEWIWPVTAKNTCKKNSLEAIAAIHEALAEPEQEPEFWPGDVLICKEDDSKVTVVHGNRGPMQLMNGKIAIAWNDNVGGEYTIEQIKEMFYRAKESEQGAPPARKPLTDEDISAIVQSMSAYTWDAHMLARAIERAHGIGE